MTARTALVAAALIVGLATAALYVYTALVPPDGIHIRVPIRPAPPAR